MWIYLFKNHGSNLKNLLKTAKEKLKHRSIMIRSKDVIVSVQ